MSAEVNIFSKLLILGLSLGKFPDQISNPHGFMALNYKYLPPFPLPQGQWLSPAVHNKSGLTSLVNTRKKVICLDSLHRRERQDHMTWHQMSWGQNCTPAFLSYLQARGPPTTFWVSHELSAKARKTSSLLQTLEEEGRALLTCQSPKCICQWIAGEWIYGLLTVTEVWRITPN